MIPRLFQSEAIAAAQQSNIILRADTGVGKTLVAILLLKQIASQPLLKERGKGKGEKKLIVFLVPVVALVIQQAKVIEEETNLKVQQFYGAMGLDFWKREQWEEKLNGADVVVLTAQVWLTILNHAYWKFENVSLVIFDECHHCSKKHPYSIIMKSHYFKLPEEQRPKVLGLTASPIYNAKSHAKAAQSILEIESILGRLFEIDSDTTAFGQKTREVLKTFVSTSISFDPILPTRFEVILRALPLKLDEFWEKVAIAKEEIGSAGSDLLLYQLLKEKLDPKFKIFNSINEDDMALEGALKEMESILSTRIYDFTNLSPKTLALFEILELNVDKQDLHCIIFCQRRLHTSVLSELIARKFAGSREIRPFHLVGHGGVGRTEEDGIRAKMAIKLQEKTVAQFRTGEINILVCTSVAEEGLDFRRCNVVIRFDELQTITGYIQSRGRARAEDSTYFVLAAEGSRSEALYLDHLAREPELQHLYRNRPEEDPIEPIIENLPIFTVESTGAILTFDNSIPLISELCSLMTDDEFDSNRPRFKVVQVGNHFKSNLLVPNFSCLKGSREFSGDIYPTKKFAKKSVAFKVLVIIYKSGGLDEYLLPVTHKRVNGEALDADGNIVGIEEAPSRIQIEFKNLAGNYRNGSKFLHRFEILASDGSSQSIGLISGVSLVGKFDQSTLYEGELPFTFILKDVVAVDLSAKEMEKLEKMNRDAAEVILSRKLGEQEFYYLWTPLLAGAIDWLVVDNSFSSEVDLTPGSIAVVTGRRFKSRFFEMVAMRTDVTSLSPTIEIVENMDESFYQRQAKFPSYPGYFKIKFDVEISSTVAEPIITLKKIPFTIKNHLRPFKLVEEKESDIFENFPISIIRTSRLSKQFFGVIMKSESLSRSIHDTLRARALISNYNLPIPLDSTSLNQVITALTPSCALTGYDFQALETYGDSFLKVATTIYIFSKFPRLDEGQLSILRQNSVDNRYLSAKALKIGLAEYSLSEPFSANSWLPYPHFIKATTEEEGISKDGLTFIRTIGKKSLADSMEAILGAALHLGGIDTALITGSRLGLCFGGETKWKERANVVPVESLQTGSNLIALEARLGYTFKDKKLLLNAITHRSCLKGVSYERLEFLGDALLDFYITSKIFSIFPMATNSGVTFLRAMLVSNSTLCHLSFDLNLHLCILHSSPLLSQALKRAEVDNQSIKKSDILKSVTWTKSLKVLGDCVEAIIGAIFFDSGNDWKVIVALLDKIYVEILPLIELVEIRDPYSLFFIEKQKRKCDSMIITAERDPDSSDKLINVICTYHSEIIGQCSHTSVAIGRQFTAQMVLDKLETMEKCDCESKAKERKKVEKLENLEKGVEVKVVAVDLSALVEVEEEDELVGIDLERISGRIRVY